NPDNPNGLHIKDFANVSSDKLEPGGPTDLTQSIRSAVARLQAADMQPPDPTGAARRLWILTDYESGRKGYGDYQKVLTTIQKARASVRVFNIGAFALDPLLPLMLQQATGFAGESDYAPPRGASVETHTPSALNEAV